MSMAEVKALPWYEHEMLLDGLFAEFSGGGGDDNGNEQQPKGEQFVPMSLDALGIKPTQM